MNINIAIIYNPIITSQLPHPDSPHHYTSWPMTTRTGLCWQRAEQQLQQRNHNWLLLLLQAEEVYRLRGWFGLVRSVYKRISLIRGRIQKIQEPNQRLKLYIDYGWNLNKDMYWWGQQYVRESWRTTGLSLVSHITMNAVSQLMIRTRQGLRGSMLTRKDK